MSSDPQQPPFPQPAVDPESRSPPPKHRFAEAVLNAAAKHVFPESEKHDIPPTKVNTLREGVSREGRVESSEHPDEKKEEEPIIAGTPLDEMTPMETPMIGGGSTGGFPFGHRPRTATGAKSLMDTTIPEGEAVISGPTAGEEEYSVKAVRPGFGAGKEIGSVKMGASALMSALNALPWQDDEEEDGSSEDEGEDEGDYSSGEEEHHPHDDRHSASMMADAASRPKMSRMGSSLQTLRPTDERTRETSGSKHHESLRFPFRENAIARRAQSPSVDEQEYQLAFRKPKAGEASELAQEGKPAIVAEVIPADSRRSSKSSIDGLSGDMRGLLNDQMVREQQNAKHEEDGEMARAGLESGGGHAGHDNTAATLDEGDEGGDGGKKSAKMAGEKQRIRREKLGQKLMEVFGLNEREEVLEEMKCWLLRSIMLKGYMYLTARHICFFAHMPDRENIVVKSGPLSKKASKTKMTYKYWVVLKNDVLSWFESTADPYFPKGNISLQYVSSCEPIEDMKVKLRTPDRNYTFIAETENARDEWVKSIRKVMFKTQHEGENVKLVIPLDAILEVEKTPTLEFAETIEIRCVDPDDSMSVDSYFFASFANTDHTLRMMNRLIAARPPDQLPQMSSEQSDNMIAGVEEDEAHTRERKKSHKGVLGGLKKALKPLVGKKEEKETTSTSGAQGSSETLHPGLEANLDVDDGYDGYPPRQSGPPPKHGEKGWSGWIKKPVVKLLHTKPSSSSSDLTRVSSTGSSTIGPSGSSSIGPSKHHKSRRSSRPGPGGSERVTEIVEPVFADSDNEDHARNPHLAPRGERESFNSDMSSESGLERSNYDVVDGSAEGRHEEDETARKFRSVFSLSDKEELIDHFPGYLYRVLPVSGRFFVSTNYFCFRSSQLLYKTKMMIPIKDLYGLKAQKAFRFNHSGLIVVIKGHEEIFLEFSSSERREACVRVLEERMETIRLASPSTAPGNAEDDRRNLESRILEDLDESIPLETREPPPLTSPNQMFESTTSTFLEFKPEPMRVTCLTIGSRGDVQPYIALCKGLQAEGHHTKIATHGEYKDWVEGHGIEFASVGGDPAELMQMCVDNGMFTVSFLREGLGKFRGWLDDLLNSSWEACQNSDLLIESPSAMGGVHIAEALQIPYYRAFTMPWTRTRAYPHAFAVPEHKKGGAYNYMTYTMFDQVFWKAISGQINRWRRKVMSIEATNFDKLEQHKIPFLYNFSPSVVPPPLDWTEWTHVTGYWFLENADESAAKDAKKWEPPEGLVEFMDDAKKSGKKIVYIGFGSIVVSDPQEMTRCVVDAVKEAGVCAILSKGWSDRGSKGKKDDDDDKDDEKDEEKQDEKEEEKEDEGDDERGDGGKDKADGVKLPKEIFSIDSIDHSWLFTRIDAACHHGGAGTTGASLRAGIPTIIKPFFGDQSFWAERVESLNVGSAVRKLTVEALSDALKKATTDEKQIAKAKVVGEMIRRENGVVRAIEAIYRDLEYAKSQIKPLPSPSDHSIPLTKMTSLLSKDSISGLSLTMSGSIKHKDKKHKPRSRPSSFYASKDDDEAAPLPATTTSREGEGDVPSPLPAKADPIGSRDTSTDRKDIGSDGSWSVVSGDGEGEGGRSRSGSVSEKDKPTPKLPEIVLGPVV